MWNPFKSVKLEPVLPNQDVKASIGRETLDPAYVAEVERSKLRSLLARTQISMIHETLAERSLIHMRGGSICPD